MSDKVKKYCTKPFYTNKPENKGTGLGLSIVCNLIKEFNGKLEIESAPNKGTTMRILIPTSV